MNEIYTYSQFSKDIKILSSIIDKSGYKFDCINCITRGGLAATAWLSQSLRIREVYTCGGKYEGTDFIFSTQINPSIWGKVLLVSDLCRTGQIVSKLKEESLKNNRVTGVKIACLHYYPEDSIIKPDFFVVEGTKDCFINYPWELT
jgi:hypoxanthine phosphoribosyltransferase